MFFLARDRPRRPLSTHAPAAPDTPSSPTRTPSPPVARRTRSKSPLSLPKEHVAEKVADKGKDNGEVGVGFASPRAAPKRRASESVAMSPEPKVNRPYRLPLVL